jgi:hypothetical protein
MIQLSRSADPSTGFRTNVGVVNLTSATTRIAIELFRADGVSLGVLERTIKPYEHRQFNDVFAAVDAGDVADGYAVATTDTDGGSFLAYASVVDNGSGDAIFLPGHTDTTPAPPADRLVVLESFVRPG